MSVGLSDGGGAFDQRGFPTNVLETIATFNNYHSATLHYVDAMETAVSTDATVQIAKRYTDYGELLSDPDVDYVHINSPIGDHAPMSIAALQAGKHVMCTVPMATTIEECQQIVEKVKETGLKYMMAETVVYSREFLFIKDM